MLLHLSFIHALPQRTGGKVKLNQLESGVVNTIIHVRHWKLEDRIIIGVQPISYHQIWSKKLSTAQIFEVWTTGTGRVITGVRI